jgi:hypothetical protein
MPRKLKAYKSRRRALDLNEEPALLIGGVEQAFESAGAARRAWFDNRDRILAWAHPGHRPYAWWAFEQHEFPPRGTAAESARLAELQELSQSEIAELRSAARLGGPYDATWRAVEAVLDGGPTPEPPRPVSESRLPFWRWQ